MPQETMPMLLTNLAFPVIVALFASAVAALWPWLMTRQRRARFRQLIRRELEEIGPVEPPDDQKGKRENPDDKSQDKRPWWQYLSKRFVHEEIFARQNISENRDFILSLDPAITYHVSQMWIAFDKRDAAQWKHHLSELAKDKHVGSAKLSCAVKKWCALIDSSADAPPLLRSRTAIAPEISGLFEARVSAYAGLLTLTRDPVGLGVAPGDFTEWYYKNSNGLLLSGDALIAFRSARKSLEDGMEAEVVRKAMSALRTELKIDLGARHQDERYVELARTATRIMD